MRELLGFQQSDNEKSVYLTFCYGHFEYQVMPFRLTNTTTTFQGYINKILTEKFDVFIIVYLDDIFIYTRSAREEHIKAVW